MMKKFLLLPAMLLVFVSSMGQKVEKIDVKVLAITVPGFTVNIEKNSKLVEAAMEQRLKDADLKTKEVEGFTAALDQLFVDIDDEPVNFFVKIEKDNKKKTQVTVCATPVQITTKSDKHLENLHRFIEDFVQYVNKFEAQKNMEEQQGELKKAQKKHASAVGAVEKIDKSIQKDQDKIAEKKKEIEKYKAKIAELQDEITKLEGGISKSQDKKADAQKDVDKAHSKVKNVEGEVGPCQLAGALLLCLQFLVVYPVRRVVTEALLSILFIFRISTLEEVDLRVALEGEDMRADAVEEPAVVTDDHGAAGEVLQTLLQGTHGVDVDVVGGLVEQQHIGFALEGEGQVQAVALAAAEDAYLLALVGAAEVESRYVRARINQTAADLQVLVAAGDHLVDRLLGVYLGVLLVDVAYLDCLADLEGACVGLLQSHDEAEERRLAAAVGAYDAHDAGRRQGEGEVFVEQLVAVGFADTIHLQHFITEPRAIRNKYLEVLLLLFDVFVEESVVGGQTGFALSMTGLGGHAHPLQLALQCFAALALLLLLHGQAGGLLLEPGAVVALPGNALAAVEFEDPARHVVEEVAVVGDGDDGAFVLLEVLLQPVDALGVEVVGRLVEQQDVGLLQEQAAEGHAAAFAAAEVGHQLVLVGTAEGVHGAFQLGVEVPSVVGFQQLRELSLAGDELVEVGIGLGEGVVHLVVLLQQVDDLLHGLLHHLLDGFGVVELGLLLEVAHAVAGGEDHLALVVLVDAGDDLHQARLAAAVEANDAYLGSVEEAQVDVFQNLAAGRYELAHAHHREDNFFVVCHII